MMKHIYSENIDMIIENIGKMRKKTFVFFKGFNAEFFSILNSKNIEALNNPSYINSDNSINIEKLDINKNLLLIKFLQSSEQSITWGYYEELIALCNMLNDIDKQVNTNLIIVDNNLFENCYPLSVEKEIINSLVKYMDDEKLENENLETYTNFYSDIISFSNTSYGIVYNEKDKNFNFHKVNFYDYNSENIIYKEGDSKNIINNLNLFEFKEKLQSNIYLKDFKLVIENKKQLKNLYPLIYLADKLELNWSIEYKDRFSNLDECDDNKYLYILKKHWGIGEKFRKINFYKNPEESMETKEISQGYIISDIINQSEKALNNKEDFRDIFITAPTGAGKSLLFQVPAIHLADQDEAVTIVITHLIALMRDQVDQLKDKRGIDFATFLNSDISFEEKESRIRKIKNGQISIIYMAPELLLSTTIENIIGSHRRLGLLVIDEAHIVTTWGRDFRADYWFIGGYIERLRKGKEKGKQFPIVCLTATAVYMGTEDTVNDTIRTLALITPKLYLGNVKRDNIKFDINVIDKKSIEGGFEEFKLNKSYERISRFISQGKKTLVYCPFTTHINNISGLLKDDEKNKVGMYYSSYDKNLKTKSQLKFKNGDFKIMLCTKAFGMGIDINDIDAVYHYAPTGNLSDYVQEIGRVARNKEIVGYAITDFTSSDLKYIRILNSLSSIRQYQLREVLRKLYSIYSKKKKRNILVSPETFSYLFGEDNLENKVKTSLLLLQKDINKYFSVLVVRPKSMFTKNFVNVPNEIEKEFSGKYGEYSKRVKDYSKRIIPGIYKNGDITITNTGTIYEVNMSEIWSNYFSNITFPDFKRQFFNGELFKFSDESAKLSARVHLTITYKEDYEKCKELLKDYSNKLSSIFSYFKAQNKFFAKKEFKDKFENIFLGTFATQDLSDIILNMFVADTSKNIGFNQNTDRYKFIQFRKSKVNSMDIEYRLMNSNYITIGSYLIKQLSQCVPNKESNIHSAYIAMTNKNKKTDILQLSIILELFGLATYEVVGGKNTEIFIRINDPLKIRKLSNEYYKNEVLTEIERKRKKSQEVLQYFMSRKLTDKERWNIIENYFLGNDEYVSEKLGIS